MKPGIRIEIGDGEMEVDIGVFESSEEASRVAASMRKPDLQLQRVSRRNPAATDELPHSPFFASHPKSNVFRVRKSNAR